MPTKSFICLDGYKIEVEQCLEEGGCRLSSRCAPRTYLRMISTDRTWTGKPSTTQLIAGTMLSFLRLTVDYAIKPDGCAFMAHGTKVHRKLQDVTDDLSLVEEKLTGETTGVTGIFDLLEVEGDSSILADFKTSGSWKVMKALGLYTGDVETDEVFKSGKRKGQRKTRKWLFQSDDMIDRRDWELQLNMYRLQIEEMGFPVDEIRLMCIVRDGNTAVARSRGILRNIYYFEIDRLPDQEVRDYFERKRKNLLLALEQGSWSEPCSEMENWDGIRCERYCPVWQQCSLGIAIHKERGERKMPIKDITDSEREQRGGKIRLGEMRTNEKGVSFPTEVEYFVMDPGTPDANYREQLIKEFHELFADKDGKVRSFRIVLPPYELDRLFPQWRMRYTSGNSLACRGDGGKAGNPGTATAYTEAALEGRELIDAEGPGRGTIICLGDECPATLDKKKCAPQGTLRFLVPELCLDTWFLTTGSINGLLNINDGIRKAQAISPGQWVPMILERVPHQLQHNGKSRTHWIVHLRLAGTLKQFREWSALTLGDVEPEAKMLEAGLPALEGSEMPMDPELDKDETLDEMTFHLAAELNVSLIDFGNYLHYATEEVGLDVVKETVRTTFGNEKKKKALLKKFNKWLKEEPIEMEVVDVDETARDAAEEAAEYDIGRDEQQDELDLLAGKDVDNLEEE